MPIARYTRFVVFGKHFLWVMTALVVALLVWIATGNSGDSGRRMVFTNMPAQMNILQNVMENPRYQGLTTHGEPYTVLSNKGTQIDDDTIALDVVRAEVAQRDGTWIALNAKNGVLNIKNKHLELTGGVNVFYNNGYELRTDHAFVDIAEGAAYGDSYVEGQGPSGTLQADQFEVLKRGQVIRFSGSVKMKLYL